MVKLWPDGIWVGDQSCKMQVSRGTEGFFVPIASGLKNDQEKALRGTRKGRSGIAWSQGLDIALNDLSEMESIYRERYCLGE